MTNIFISTAAVSIAIASLFSGCATTPENHEVLAKKKINEAAEEVKETISDSNDKAKQNAINDWKKFKASSEHDIASMEVQTSELGQKISKSGRKENIEIKKQLTAIDQKIQASKQKLQQRNLTFETDIEKFDESIVTRNESFKREFKHNTDALNTSLKDFFKNNIK